MKSLLRLIKWSEGIQLRPTEIPSPRFLFCGRCGRVLDPRSIPENVIGTTQVCLYATQDELFEYGKRYIFSKKKKQRGETILSPIIPQYLAVSRELAQVHIMLLDLLWLWQLLSLKEFLQVAEQTSIVTCLDCQWSLVSIIETKVMKIDE